LNQRDIQLAKIGLSKMSKDKYTKQKTLLQNQLTAEEKRRDQLGGLLIDVQMKLRGSITLQQLG
jgi:hypothetical protein